MGASKARHAEVYPPVAGRRESLSDQVRRRGLRRITSVDEMARDDVFESDRELDEFLAHVYAGRHANLT